jgi:CheY-like chemotaxis protein
MPLKALLVDDDPLVLKTLKGIFEYKKFDVSTATSAQGAISALAQATYDVVVSDMRMETDFAGYEVVRHAKSQRNRPLVVILSAYPIPAAEWRSSGADAMFIKGGGVFRILEDIERLLRANSSREQSA